MTDFDVLAATPTNAEWTLQQCLHFQRVYKAAAEGQHRITLPDMLPIPPAMWLEVAKNIATLAAEKFAPLPDLGLEG